MYNHKNIERLLKTAKGQIDGILKMLEEDRECIEISYQITAAQSILKKVNTEILTCHLGHCVKESFQKDNEVEKQKKLDDFIKLLNKIIK